MEKVDASAPRTEAAQWMVSRKVGSLVVTREDRVRGVFTEHDLTRAAAHHAAMDTETVQDWMTDFPHPAAPEWTPEHAADVMVEHAIRHLPIMDHQGRLAGMVSIKDLVWAMRAPPGRADPVEHRRRSSACCAKPPVETCPHGRRTERWRP